MPEAAEVEGVAVAAAVVREAAAVAADAHQWVALVEAAEDPLARALRARHRGRKLHGQTPVDLR